MSSRGKHLRELEVIAAELGWSYAGQTARHHLRWVHPSGATMITGSALSDGSSWLNAVAQLRRGARHLATETKR